MRRQAPQGTITTVDPFSVERWGREGADRKRLRYVRNVRLRTADDLVVTLQLLEGQSTSRSRRLTPTRRR